LIRGYNFFGQQNIIISLSEPNLSIFFFQNFSDEIQAIDSDICSQEVLIKAFDSRKKTLENDIFNLQGCFLCLCEILIALVFR
jgi:hypothetical protein